MNQLQNNASAAARGVLPYEDTRLAASDVNERANMLGYGGSSAPQVAADLGLKRHDLMNKGMDLQTALGNFYAQNFPMNRRQSPADFMINPSTALPLAIAERQFGTTHETGERNLRMALEGAADPAAAAQMNLQSMMSGYNSGGGGMFGGGGNNWSQMLNMAMRAYGAYSGTANPYMNSASTTANAGAAAYPNTASAYNDPAAYNGYPS